MKLTVLVENTSCSDLFGSAHGLSFFIEAADRKLLFDFGPDRLFLDNAAALGIDITSVQYAALSHGHDDHGGGLRDFLSANSLADVYVRSDAFDTHWSKTPAGDFKENGLDKSLAADPRIILTGETCRMFPGALLFSGVTDKDLFSPANETLYKFSPAGPIRDDFSHEQSLLIEEEGKYFLFAGCAHAGIAGIMKKACDLCGRAPAAVFAGFHLMNPRTGLSVPDEFIDALASRLNTLYPDTAFYTCHCTGSYAFELLGRGMRIDRLSTGQSLKL